MSTRTKEPPVSARPAQAHRPAANASTVSRPVSVEELRRAWHALQDGQFRASTILQRPLQHAATEPPPDAAARVWLPEAPVIPVLGAHAQSGATTTALALATAFGSTRVIECASATGTGLGCAATAELGTSANGWRLGRRGDVWIARRGPAHRGIDIVPVPDPPAPEVHVASNVLDVGWDLGHVLTTAGWVNTAVTAAPGLVLTAVATVPGLRRLETALTQLASHRVVVAVLGPPVGRWPREVRAVSGALTTDAIETGRLITVSADRHLRIRGLDSTPLPRHLTTAARGLLERLTLPDLDRARTSSPAVPAGEPIRFEKGPQ